LEIIAVKRIFMPILALIFAAESSSSGAEVCSFDEASADFAELVSHADLPGGGILVGGKQGIFFESYVGSYSADTIVAIASATKLLSAVRILQAAEREEIDLDAPVSTYLSDFSGEKGTMTVRQMFSHTAGYGDDLGAAVISNSSITLAQAVAQIACCRPLNAGYTVGGQFSYGGVSMHVAGRVVEVVENGDWQALWQQELGTHLGTTTIDWQGLGPTQNYRIAGGAQSNLRDYGKLLHMLANGGRGNNQKILRTSTIRVLWNDNAEGLPVAYAPENVTPPVRYGLGSWLYNDRPITEAPLIHSLGAFGFFPWVDFDREIFGIFMIKGNTGINDVAVNVYDAMLDSIKARYDASGCTPVELFDEIFVDAFDPN
jgi:CubicO group peptidase (beta-lactamase class C family)